MHTAKASRWESSSAADEVYRAWSGTAPRRSHAARTASAATAERTPPAIPPEVDGLFPPRTGSLCSWCDFRGHCPEGRAAGDERRPWDGLADG